MKILFCNKYNFNFSGTESYLFELMELARSKGHETALFSMADPRGEASPYDRHLSPLVDFKSGKQSLLTRARLAARAIYSIEARRRLRGMISEFRPNVAHVRNIYHHLSPSILWELKARGVPVLYHLNDFKLLCPSYNMVSHGSPCERCTGGKFRHVVTEGCYQGPRGTTWVLAAEAYLHLWLRTYEKCVDLFLAPSQFVKDKLVENGWDAGKISVSPHFQILPDRGAEPEGDAPILYFGRLSPEKGVHDLLRAMQALPHVRLQIAGEGPQRTELERLAAELKLENVEFLGHLQGEALQFRIAMSRFTVLPSRAYETLGKSILESYAHGRAVVASDLGSRRELVQDGRTGLLFPPGDVSELQQAMGYLVSNPRAASQMGAAGRELVRERHSAEAHFRELSALYESLRKKSARDAHSEAPTAAHARGRPRHALRIAFIGGRGVGSQYSGIETYYEEAGGRLVARGHEVTVYCRTYFTPSGPRYGGLRLLRLPTIRTKHLETAVHTFLSTVHAVFCDYDIIHYHALGPALFSFIPRLFGKRTVVTVQGLDGRRRKWGVLAATVLRVGELAAVRLPHATMVVSRTLQSHYRERHGAETVYVPNGTTLRGRGFPSGVDRWGLSPKQYILFLGRLSPEKNCHLLLQAYLQTKAKVDLVLAGGACGSDAYASGLRAYESERIHFTGWVSGVERDQLLSNAMLLVLPSDIEGLSLVLLEAMGAGVCVLASDIAENRELVENAGFTFRGRDVHDLARMIELLSEHPEMRRDAENRARARIRREYLWDDVADQIEGVYRQVSGRTEAEEMAPEISNAA
jgi:glycosyltransferase involved in cell wall biosynthesis